MFGMQVRLQNLPVILVYQDHRVKVKVTEAKVVSVCQRSLQSEASESWQLLNLWST